MIVFVSNFLNHHQLPVAVELYQLTNGNYHFIETTAIPEAFKVGGYSEFTDLPWLIQAWKSVDDDLKARSLIINADVVVWCQNLYLPLIKQRLEQGKLTFEFGERWFKRGIINLLSPRLLKSQLYYHLYFYNKPLYRLNASAYAANDMAMLRSYRNRMFKWGYFTTVGNCSEKKTGSTQGVSSLKILFVARFLNLKHPELPVTAAGRLKDKGYKFELNMYGSGPEHDRIKALISSLGLQDCVFLKGNLPNDEILQEMKQHDIFLFTSDRHEGWGAVLNESMSNGCAVIASDKIGSVPFLIEDGVNGLIFKDQSVDDLTLKLEYLINNPDKCTELGNRAISTMCNIWSPGNAARNLLKLIDGIKSGNPQIIDSGPCSPAYPIK